MFSTSTKYYVDMFYFFSLNNYKTASDVLNKPNTISKGLRVEQKRKF